jgi:hypothetical protein
MDVDGSILTTNVPFKKLMDEAMKSEPNTRLKDGASSPVRIPMKDFEWNRSKRN